MALVLSKAASLSTYPEYLSSVEGGCSMLAFMNYYWIGVVIGLYMVWGGAIKSTAMPYRLIHARASLLWKDKAHLFLQVSGLIVIVVMVGLARLT